MGVKCWYSIIEEYQLDKTGKLNANLNANVEIHQEKINTEGVGNELSYYYTINGEEIRSESLITVNILKPVKIVTEIIENDPSSDDVGTASFEEIVSLKSLAKGMKVTQYVNVHESHGKDAGNTARYKVEYSFKLVKPLIISALDLNKSPSRPQEPTQPERRDIELTFWQTIYHDSFSQILIVIGFCAFVSLSIRVIYLSKKELNMLC